MDATHSNLQALTILIGNAWLASYVVQLVVSLFVIAPIALDKLGVKNAILALPVFTLIGFTLWRSARSSSHRCSSSSSATACRPASTIPPENVLGGALPAQIGPKLKFLLDNLVLPGGGGPERGRPLVTQRRIAGNRRGAGGDRDRSSPCSSSSRRCRVRSLYVGAIYERLRTHAISAVATSSKRSAAPTPEQIAELQGFIRQGDDKVREFAAAALGKLSPETFAAMLPELTASDDAMLRRLAFQMAPPDVISADQLDAAAVDPDRWVRAAAAVAGAASGRRGRDRRAVCDRLIDANDVQHRAAAVWAASFVGDHKTVAAALADAEPRVRLEAISQLRQDEGRRAGIGGPLIACLRDTDIEVRREALRQAVRWTPPAELEADFVAALVDGLASGDRDVRRLAAEAMAAQSPDALVLTLPLLQGRGDAAPATIEALVRSGRPELFEHARGHLEHQMTEGAAPGAARSAPFGRASSRRRRLGRACVPAHRAGRLRRLRGRERARRDARPARKARLRDGRARRSLRSRPARRLRAWRRC